MTPFFVPKVFSHFVDNATKVGDEQVYDPIVKYELTYVQRIFVLLEYHHSCKLATIILYLLGVNITLNILIFVLASVPSFQFTPESCRNPSCQNDVLCPNRTICQPIPYQSLVLIDVAGIVLFSFDYFLRLATCSTVSPRLAGLTNDPNLEMPQYWVFIRYICRFNSIIDFISILPFYFLLAKTNTYGGLSSGFIRVLRLPRLLQCMSDAHGGSAIAALLAILFRCLHRSSRVLVFTLYFYFIGIILFSTIIFVLEGGVFVVNSNYPDGAYLRDNFRRTELEESIFISIPVSIYFTVVTTTTLGYGDFTCQTVGGRAIACFLSFAGVIVLALPIAIIGSNFFDFYRIYLDKIDEQNRQILSEETRSKLSFRVESIDKMKIALRHEEHCRKLVHMMQKLTIMTTSQERALQRSIGLLNIIKNREIHAPMAKDVPHVVIELDRSQKISASQESNDIVKGDKINKRINFMKRHKNNHNVTDIGKLKNKENRNIAEEKISYLPPSEDKFIKFAPFELEYDDVTVCHSNSPTIKMLKIKESVQKRAWLEEELGFNSYSYYDSMTEDLSTVAPIMGKNNTDLGSSSFPLTEARSTETHIQSKIKNNVLPQNLTQMLPKQCVKVSVRPMPWMTPKQYIHIDKSDDAHFREVNFISVKWNNLFCIVIAFIATKNFLHFVVVYYIYALTFCSFLSTVTIIAYKDIK